MHADGFDTRFPRLRVANLLRGPVSAWHLLYSFVFTLS